MKRLLTAILISVCQVAYAGENDIFFNSIKTEDGLTHHSVASIYEDELGFIWIGTREGLNLYNGSSIINFKTEEDNSNSLLYDSVQKICGNRNGKIYIQGSHGVSEYDMKTDTFSIAVQGNISAMTYGDKLYFARGHRIFSSDGTGTRIFHEFKNRGITVSVLKFIGNTLWAGTEKDGVIIIADEEESLPDSPECCILNIYGETDRSVWICTDGKGLIHYTKSDTGWEAAGKYITSDTVRECCVDKKGDVWIASFSGLKKLYPSSGRISVYTPSNHPGSLNHTSITCLTQDRGGNIWLGSYFGGVNYFNPDRQIYSVYRQGDTEKEGLSFHVIGKMTEDDSGRIWIATEGGGVNCLDRKSGSIKWLNTKNSRLSDDNIKSLFWSGGILWIGTHSGLNSYDTRTQDIRTYSKNNSALPSDIVSDIIRYDGKLLVSTFRGLCLLDPETGRTTGIPELGGIEIGYATDLLLSTDKKLWIVTGENVFSYDSGTGKTCRYFDDKANTCHGKHCVTLCIFEDSRHDIYAATWGNGLFRFDKEKGSFEKFVSQNNGLLSNCIYGIIEVSPGKLLISCNSGYSLLDTDTRSIVCHSTDTGMPLSSFNEYSLFLTRDGEIFMGSVDGLLAFREFDHLQEQENRIIPYRLIVNDKEIKPGDGTGILSEAMPYTGSIRLKADQNVFSIRFSTLNYTHGKENIYYRLNHFSDEWINTGNSRTITYSNLPAGHYELEIADRSSGSEDAGCTIGISIVPPLYRSAAAIVLYCLVAAAVIYYFLRSWSERVRLSEEVKYEKQRLTDNEEKTRFKLDFYTDISHEFKTPLTLIVGETEMMMKYPDRLTSENYRRAANIHRNSIRLKNLIDEQIEFRKFEKDKLKLDISRNDMVNSLRENYMLFKTTADKRGITFTFTKTVSELFVWYDSWQMQKVITNLLSNAFKFTPDGGKIDIYLQVDEDWAKFGVSDNGIGIRKEDQENVFGYYFYTSDRPLKKNASRGSGIGLALCKSIVELHHGKLSLESAPGKGSKFEVCLKLGKSHFSDNELNTKHEKTSDTFNHIAGSSASEDEIMEPENSCDNTAGRHLPCGMEHKSRILIIDDSTDTLDMIKAAFESSYDVLTASNGEDGYRTACELIPDLIISDVMMPGMSGIELCRKLKTDINTCHIPVILLTADTSAQNNLKGYQYGADDYIEKPFNLTLLETRCRNLINIRHTLQEKFRTAADPDRVQALATNDLDRKIMDKAMTIIQENINNPDFSISIFAREMGMARTKLFNKIKAITGQTPNSLIMNARLTKSSVLLIEHPEMNIGEIADMTGFSSTAYFSKCFKDKYGESPQTYRKKA